MDLIRIGGKGDEGVDLMGWWWLPDSTFRDGDHGQEAEEGPLAPDGWRRLRVFGQCKAEKRKAGPKYVREMEGVVYRHLEALSQNSHTDASRYPVIALLVSLSGFSIGAVRRANASSVPFFLLHISPQEDSSEDDASVHVLRDACWNLALQGVLQGKGEMRCERRIGENGEDLRISHLWWEGKRWEKNTHTAPKYR